MAGYLSCGMTDIEGFLTIYGHSDNLLNNKVKYKDFFASLLRKRNMTTNIQQNFHTRSDVVHVLLLGRPEAFQPHLSQRGKPRFTNGLRRVQFYLLPSPPGTPPGICNFFLTWRSIPFPRARRKRQFPTPGTPHRPKLISVQ